VIALAAVFRILLDAGPFFRLQFRVYRTTVKGSDRWMTSNWSLISRIGLTGSGGPL
jgi:hypothetical protein